MNFNIPTSICMQFIYVHLYIFGCMIEFGYYYCICLCMCILRSANDCWLTVGPMWKLYLINFIVLFLLVRCMLLLFLCYFVWCDFKNNPVLKCDDLIWFMSYELVSWLFFLCCMKNNCLFHMSVVFFLSRNMKSSIAIVCVCAVVVICHHIKQQQRKNICIFIHINK